MFLFLNFFLRLKLKFFFSSSIDRFSKGFFPKYLGLFVYPFGLVFFLLKRFFFFLKRKSFFSSVFTGLSNFLFLKDFLWSLKFDLPLKSKFFFSLFLNDLSNLLFPNNFFLFLKLNFFYWHQILPLAAIKHTRIQAINQYFKMA